jgi:hypothetical protein
MPKMLKYINYCCRSITEHCSLHRLSTPDFSQSHLRVDNSRELSALLNVYNANNVYFLLTIKTQACNKYNNTTDNYCTNRLKQFVIPVGLYLDTSVGSTIA